MYSKNLRMVRLASEGDSGTLTMRMEQIVTGLISALIGILAGYALRVLLGRVQADSIEKQAAERLKAADGEVARRLREADIQARAEVVQAREAFEQSVKARRKELEDFDGRLALREENIEKRLKVVEDRENAAKARHDDLQKLSERLDARRVSLDAKIREAERSLEHISGLTKDQAKAEMRKEVEDVVRAETGALTRRLQEEAKETASRDAAVIVANAIERYAATHSSTAATTTVLLPNDEIKGRIVGREGRNVRAIEAATGITLIVDGTPEAVVISGFDPVRREIARQALETLVSDGRIHPASIEEAVAKARENMEETILQAGREAAYAAKQQGVDTEILRHLGRLKFRTSYSQNVLEHSLEVSSLMGAMAGELGLDITLARRIGLFHDIGKSVSMEVDGGHARIGADLLRRKRENAVVVNAVASHHGEEEQTSVYATLCMAADAISSSRPGARNESSEVYVERIAKLERIASSRKGVKSAYAIQAGREVRVIVDPEQLGDNEAMLLAQEICRAIENELRFPGQIRVTVVREKRCIEYAR